METTSEGADDAADRHHPRPPDGGADAGIHGRRTHAGRGGAVLRARGARDRGVRRLPPARAAGDAEGAHGMRKDALRGAHGVAAEAPARDHRLPRRPVGERPHRALPDPRRRDGVGRRAADHGGAAGRHLLPGRGQIVEQHDVGARFQRLVHLRKRLRLHLGRHVAGALLRFLHRIRD